MPGTAVATMSSAPVCDQPLRDPLQPVVLEPVDQRRVRRERPGPHAVGQLALLVAEIRAVERGREPRFALDLHDQHAHARAGSRDRERRGDGGLADTPLARHDDHPGGGAELRELHRPDATGAVMRRLTSAPTRVPAVARRAGCAVLVGPVLLAAPRRLRSCCSRRAGGRAPRRARGEREGGHRGHPGRRPHRSAERGADPRLDPRREPQPDVAARHQVRVRRRGRRRPGPARPRDPDVSRSRSRCGSGRRAARRRASPRCSRPRRRSRRCRTARRSGPPIRSASTSPTPPTRRRSTDQLGGAQPRATAAARPAAGRWSTGTLSSTEAVQARRDEPGLPGGARVPDARRLHRQPRRHDGPDRGRPGRSSRPRRSSARARTAAASRTR